MNDPRTLQVFSDRQEIVKQVVRHDSAIGFKRSRTDIDLLEH
jgi:hypothetical protein